MAHDKYLTYEEYIGYGGTLSEADFIIHEFRCRKRIDYLTDSRVQNMESVPEAVKQCMMALLTIDTAAGIEAQTSKDVKSFNTDGYSETYGAGMSSDDAEKASNEQIKTLLWGEYDDEGTPLLYRGVVRSCV